MTLQEFQTAFDILKATQHLRCRVCGLVGRHGCPHLVDDFVPAPITGTPAVGGALRMLPPRTGIRIDPLTGLYLK